ncbi:hypothetical protein GCM10022255_111530 [Dactylosporangium darangshiense]|uniref:Uncharacterized protein n=1 Tax=Dactylosporangium darangshiense TaxID=579108 RepID=A0ABP8DUU7_9ACTN
METRKVAPSPGAVRSVTWPPWADTSATTIDRPSPELSQRPGAARVGAVDALEDPGGVLRLRCQDQPGVSAVLFLLPGARDLGQR